MKEGFDPMIAGAVGAALFAKALHEREHQAA
jgi:activator of 2-hydroxyglutaryl-CoA dehydratase